MFDFLNDMFTALILVGVGLILSTTPCVSLGLAFFLAGMTKLMLATLGITFFDLALKLRLGAQYALA